MRGSNLLPSSHNCFDCENSFHPSGAIQESFSLILRSPSSQVYSFSAFTSRSPNLTSASPKYSLVSSWSLHSLVYKFSPSIFVRFLILPGELCLATFIFNSYSGSFKFSLPLLSYQFISCFQIPPVVPSIPCQVYAISLLISSTRISSMPNPLLVINLNWWRIRIT